MRTKVAVLSFVAASLLGGVTADAEPLPRAEVEAIVRDYLLREPEVVYEAIQALQQRHQVAEAERQKAALAAHRPELYESTGDPLLGDPEGDVTLVEFFDYQCGYCRRMMPEVQALLDRDPNIRLVMKEFPILGPQSIVAAQAALAADRQGKYREMHLALAETEDLSEPSIIAIARARGIDPDRLLADMQSDAVQKKLESNLRLAQALGINGTPAFAIGDTLIPGVVEGARLAQLVAEQRQLAN